MNVEEFEDGFEGSLETTFAVGQKVRIIGGHRRKGELCEVINMTPKSVWVKAYDGSIFLKRMHHVVVESQAHTLKREEEFGRKIILKNNNNTQFIKTKHDYTIISLYIFQFTHFQYLTSEEQGFLHFSIFPHLIDDIRYARLLTVN